jgi:hypothetical protein
MELVRTILMQTEASDELGGWMDLEIDGYPHNAVVYHVKLLAEAGLLEAQDLTTMGGVEWKPKGLTWAGHEFLDAAKNDTAWNKTKEIVQDKGGSIPFEVFKALLIKVAASLVGLG